VLYAGALWAFGGLRRSRLAALREPE
jgi:hypothetical protein